MAPKKKAAKRDRSESPTPGSPSKTLSKRTNGKPVRSPEVLEMLKVKRSESEIWEGVEPFHRRTTDADFDPATMMKFITWNVAGLRGVLRKDGDAIKHFIRDQQPDVLCLQETKLAADQVSENKALGVVDGYDFVDHPCSAKRGYSGTRTYMRKSTMVSTLGATTTRGFFLPGEKGAEEGAGDDEGRVLNTFFKAPWSPQGHGIALVNTYVPNSGMTLDRLQYRTREFDVEMREFLQRADASCKEATAFSTNSATQGGLIWTGDLNVAERDFDRYYSGTFKSMQECSGFTPEERESFRQTLTATNAVDSFRLLYPNAGPAYTFWSMRINGRARGTGWRLDYFVVSSALAPRVVDCFPLSSVLGSDHCPTVLWLKSA